MITVASLFQSQAEATEAIDALADSAFSDVDYRVYEHEMAQKEGEVQTVGLPMTEPGVGATGPAVVVSSAGTRLEDEELADFFRDAVESDSAVLIVADVKEEQVPGLERFFRRQGGRTAEES